MPALLISTLVISLAAGDECGLIEGYINAVFILINS